MIGVKTMYGECKRALTNDVGKFLIMMITKKGMIHYTCNLTHVYI